MLLKETARDGRRREIREGTTGDVQYALHEAAIDVLVDLRQPPRRVNINRRRVALWDPREGRHLGKKKGRMYV